MHRGEKETVQEYFYLRGTKDVYFAGTGWILTIIFEYREERYLSWIRYSV